MARIVESFGAPQEPVRHRKNQVAIQEEVPTINQVRPPRQEAGERDMGARVERREIRNEIPEEQPRRIVMVNRDQNAEEVIHRVRQDNMLAKNNLTTMIERIMAQNGLNTGFRRSNYASSLTDFILQAELPRGCKVPKFTKFSGDTDESIVEHVARYLIEAGGDLV